MKFVNVCISLNRMPLVLSDPRGFSEKDVIDFCKGQIAHYKIPRYVRIRDSLPMTVTGKAQKYKMREAMLKELKLENHVEHKA